MQATQQAVEGLLHYVDDKRDGQLRDPAQPLRQLPGNIIVPRQLIREFDLRPGLLLRGIPRSSRAMTRIESVEGKPVDWFSRTFTHLNDAVALDPQPQIKLEFKSDEYSTRIMDILAPIGFGQRGLIVAPPRTGKTMLLQNIARGIHHNHPDVELILLLIDERPEEVTDMKRNVPGTVYASSNDNDIDKHRDLAQIVIERCKRKVEMGRHVVVLLDSLTRLGRAFNQGSNTGRTLTGGLDAKALEVPKRLFGAARKVENGGSLTIIASCLVDTGSKMDQVIFEEFKGTGNMELTLDRGLANQRIFPAYNLQESGTRKEEKLLAPDDLIKAQNIRRHLMNMAPPQQIRTLHEVMSRQKTNRDLYNSMSV